MKSLLAAPRARPTSADLAWRVLALVNLFRLLTPLLLFALAAGVSRFHVQATWTPVGP